MSSIIRKIDIVRNAPDAWESQYKTYLGSDKADVTRRLLALDRSTITAEQVNEIIGNTSWTGNCCDECGADCAVLIRFGEARWYDLCLSCLQSGIEKIRAAKP